MNLSIQCRLCTLTENEAVTTKLLPSKVRKIGPLLYYKGILNMISFISFSPVNVRSKLCTLGFKKVTIQEKGYLFLFEGG